MSIPKHYTPPKNDTDFVYRRAWFRGYYGMREERRPYTDDSLVIAYQVGYLDGYEYKNKEARGQAHENG